MEFEITFKKTIKIIEKNEDEATKKASEQLIDEILTNESIYNVFNAKIKFVNI